MYTGMLHTHTLVVMLFLVLYLIKTTLLMLDKKESLEKFSGKMKVPEIIISTLFLLTGIYLAMNSGNLGNWFWVKMIAVLTSIPLAIVAFKRMNKSLALVAIMFLVYSYGISETKSPTFKPEVNTNEFATANPDVLGKTIYESKCTACHGMDGKQQLSGAKDLTVSEKTFDEKIDAITNGKNAMMPYKNILSEVEINAVAGYVESLKK
ncbi:MAG: SirB2 family protein [Bacteroidia bacterium]